ncbi:ubiquitin C-terminal hydrolase Ubp6 [Schizosaccharomyces pombe]|uniref:Ubiquitin carboxyl-terminal hydrolase 6 n=1 Tax=Schizosaccharomyces pombe (strain 972 / ATCC 24843) TaxID=284812 RepID=UBP6_SCHPO|nr:ubiquitin hydrolase Ubp6 [Schizosaccharomyces pombe]Q92353.2 RecName: Full=Ubiquitin carboxyl-terminal hydrolase 6; AltName: Full=Deubiquitinating enzyme 6; AltName: Full=Ubiquitin thiollesterase 6; AltName: Full=Ubiquitin-specific-processing protease 6 [Schizosaccharomyces pombe 972h-]CAB03610.2 ubiquitin C-terminal hydrolase Ubp6 [Schizosaccharomyces pombe]|eukprot:NP_594117.2 ubiquitin hydrolase Ubp6 [Schizosaccharomyces pombe]
MMIPIAIRWQGKKYDLEIEPNETGSTLKHQLYSLTQVPPERQKVIVKGGQLKDDVLLGSVGIKPNATLLMMGTAGELPTAMPIPAVESVEQEESEDDGYPSGLINLGNTCYMNSTVQMLRAIPELSDAVSQFNSSGGLVAEYRTLLNSMQSNAPVTPMRFLQSLRMEYPQFAEMSRETGGYAQQDAEECWSFLLSVLQRSLSSEWVQKNMAGKLLSTMKCDENEVQEQPSISHDTFLSLPCHISMHTSYMTQGILEGLTQKISKHSDVLNRDAMYSKISRISRLPNYLTVNFVRFYWKASIGKKAKILRKVKFPFELDAVEFCTPELSQKLIPVRDKLREIEKNDEEHERAAKRIKIQPSEDEKEAEAECRLTQVATCQSLVDPELADDEGANPTGLYDLVGVLSHAGASASSGHYQAWIRNSNNRAEWFRFNDAKVSIVPAEKIETLDGGGEADSAYILLYKAKDIA